MRIVYLLPALLLVYQLSFGQTTPYTAIQLRFNLIKVIIQPDIIQLPDSAIVFPVTGLTNIRVIPGNMISGPYTEIELWIIDNEGKIIYNNTIATDKNDGSYPLETEYCRYMKLQSNYLRIQRHTKEAVAVN
ncbi:MAG: hypothetical protein K0R51_309 [Cytophagaceae bacterium]|jgi:hypothetical protein|nr:hypothetical protein [Cytophagaceae bacterium]